MIAIAVFVAGFFPSISAIYEKHLWFQNLILAVAGAAGLVLAFLESRHSVEANEHRAELIQLTKEANESREEANQFRHKTLELQVQVHQLQASIEEKLTKIRLYVIAHNIDGGSPQLRISNLSEFDLWISKVELVVTKANHGQPATKLLKGETRLSSGHSDDGYNLWGNLLAINGNREDLVDMTFHVTVSATGIVDDPKTFESPSYHLTTGPANTKVLELLR